ncbi:amino acid ABC transporter ATP-binding protein [Pseudonocardia sp. DLS-67]
MSASAEVAGTTRSGRRGSDVVLRIANVSKSFGDFAALSDVSLDVHENEVVVIIGQSGSGKSTLVRCIDQLETIDDGAIVLDGVAQGVAVERGVLRKMRERPISAQRRKIGMVFQNFNLFAQFTAMQNITDPLVRVHGMKKKEAVERARHLLSRVGLPHRENAYPITLSGGEQQRVAIARALGPNPRVMLFDEPTSALDPERVEEVMVVIRELAQRGRTMVVVTHDLNFAREIGDWCVFMDGGSVVEQGLPADVLSAPRSDRLRAFIGRTESDEHVAAQDGPAAPDEDHAGSGAA